MVKKGIRVQDKMAKGIRVQNKMAKLLTFFYVLSLVVWFIGRYVIISQKGREMLLSVLVYLSISGKSVVLKAYCAIT